MNKTLRSMRYLTLIIFFVLGGSVCAQNTGVVVDANALQSLSPEQRGVVEAEMGKSGNVLSPEAIKSLQERPEFQGVTPEDIARGKEMIGKKEAAGQQPEEQAAAVEPAQPVSPIGQKPDSLFNRYHVVGPYQEISTELTAFGYEFFSNVAVRSLTPRKDMPVSPEYAIGPGDEIKMLLWGRVNAQYSLVVDRDGNITVPQIGPLHVAGMRFNEMKNFLTGQAQQIIGANINVTTGALKSIQVFVLGEVRRPGSYTLDSFSTITNALLSAGGPTEIGSLRNIQLKRNNRPVTEMDFYDFLLKGDKSEDRALQSGDVVFVPTTGPLVGIAGNVKRPAIYELKAKNDLLSVFDMAGGVIPSAYTQHIQVERIQKNERTVVVDINDKDLTKSKNFILQDGDLVKVFSIVDKNMNAVFLAGNVKRPGKYEYKPGMRVRDLIKDTGELLSETHFEYALIKRAGDQKMEPQLIPFDLGRLLFGNDEAGNIPLEPLDNIYIFSGWFFKDRPKITVAGEARKTGTFDLLENYRVKDAILEAGGLTKDAVLHKGEIFRTEGPGVVSQVYFDVGRAMADGPEDNILLRDMDKIVIHSIWESRYKHTVSIAGDVNRPGEYALVKDMRVSDLVFSAGNTLESAYLENAEISSYVIEAGKEVNVDYREINLRAALANDPGHNLILKPYDRLLVKRMPGWQEQQFASVAGEVGFPGKYIIKKGEKLSSLIERAGGYSDGAYLRGAVFTRERVRELQQKSLNEMISRLERELLAEGSMQVAISLSKEEVEAKKTELEQKQKFIESLRKVPVSGRMAIRMAHLRLLKGSEYDIELEQGDHLYIPMKNSVVDVTGAVMSRGSYIYSERLDFGDYVEMAGGYTRYADEGSVYVLKVDGSARKLSKGRFNWNSSKSRWEMSGFGEDIKDIEPGDTIVVPEKLERVAWMRETKDISQILFQIAATTGVVVALF
ncbi:MAG: SLBB domain-containing protein [Nitrospirae bacterium]|nr:SLBB domain-containing protein [Nitrospirota bacterium]